MTMRDSSRPQDYYDRPIKQGADALSTARFEPLTEFLIDSEEFIDVMQEVHGFEISRRTLQLYSSPRFKLLPQPIHKNGHRSYYAHPEHTERLAVILHLSTRLFMPLKAIRSLLRVYPERHYGLILKDVLTAQELNEFVEVFGHGLEVKDFLFHKVVRVLQALHESDEPEILKDETAKDKALFHSSHEFERWIHSEKRERTRHVLVKHQED